MVLVSVSGFGVPNRCIDLEELSVIRPDQIRPCPAFSGLASSDENCRDPKSAGGRKADPATQPWLLGLSDWSFPVTAAVLKRGFLEVFCAVPTLAAVWQWWSVQPWFAVAKPCWHITLTSVGL